MNNKTEEKKQYKFRKKTIQVQDLGVDNALELVSNHYKWGEDYDSNSILVDSSSNVVAINDNGCEWSSLIFCGTPKSYDGHYLNGEYTNSNIRLKDILKAGYLEGQDLAL